jgi:hypothetical protein
MTLLEKKHILRDYLDKRYNLECKVYRTIYPFFPYKNEEEKQKDIDRLSSINNIIEKIELDIKRTSDDYLTTL